jgi:outer membrane protein OmpA-like peptidoglycan-associated protein/uncharacterized protein (UPF0333 family)
LKDIEMTMMKTQVSNWRRATKSGQRGASIIEFAIVGPLITLIGLSAVQYGLMFNTKNHINHAAFMAARAGAMNHALLNDSANIPAGITGAYFRALAPLYGGGGNAAEIAASVGKATADMVGKVQIQILNPTEQSFNDWADPALSATVGKGKGTNGSDAMVIPNGGQANKGRTIGPESHQTIQDANLLKLRIVHGYKAGVPFVRNLYQIYLTWMHAKNPNMSVFEKGLIAQGISVPGPGNQGNPQDVSPPHVTTDPPPQCASILGQDCHPPTDPGTGGGGDGDGGTGGGTLCDEVNVFHDEAGDAFLFAFDSADLTPEAQAMLDNFIEQSKDKGFDSVEINGYTDPIGADDYNQKLSLQRAEAVKRYLSDKGFTSKPMTTSGRGKQDPVVARQACPGPETSQEVKDCLAPNRRVEIILKNVKKSN